MTNCTQLFGTAAALLLTVSASADLQYGDAILSAESNCFAGSDQQVLQQSIGVDNAAEVHSSCGGGMTSAYLETGESWFILSAGSTVPGQTSSGSKSEIPVIIDGGNGAGAVEVEFTIDRPTLFRMSRSIEGSKVRFWEGNEEIAVLNNSDEETPLPKGTYWATVETDQYGTPVWAEIDWDQQDDDKTGDLDEDGKVDSKDLALLLSIISNTMEKDSKNSSNKKSKNFPTGGDCTNGSKKGSKLDSASNLQVKGTPTPRPKPQQGGLAGDLDSVGSDRPGQEAPQLGSNSSSNRKAPIAPTGLGDGPGATTDKDASDKDSKDKGSDDKADKSYKNKPAKVLAPTLPKSKRKGDLDGDGKVDIRDIVFLMARI